MTSSGRTTTAHRTEPYYDLLDDWDLIAASLQSEYGIRISREIENMPWSEFASLLSGIGPDTALGRVVAIRSEEDREVLKRFSPAQRRIRADWQRKLAARRAPEETEAVARQLVEFFKTIGTIKEKDKGG